VFIYYIGSGSACTPKTECKINPSVCPPSGKQTKYCTDLNNCGSKDISEETACTPGACSGCLQNDKCIPYGTRMDLSGQEVYCSINGKLNPQKENSEGCNLDYECKNNLCSSEKCTSIEEIKKEIGGLQATLIKLVCKVTNLFDLNGYNQCISDYGASA
jgi:hypothetical protein